ncbi:NH(3)-dependent NAD(+) synthetase [Syntrophomonas zehnderi OL-4]|uniref:NH(3)-dependent NAD(+) synthetase n=1 Tax=Syntrophomonas zehnderi OL-4 TaxID=690567 RepID=A0A0E4GES1_9FIRM|nr:NAD(+) synthase [Syntrophomonas zehnderi]CFX94917.1 NH(3)-dependent NAD(+) synthetase [Syntrophomonas zehnderi OL-4]
MNVAAINNYLVEWLQEKVQSAGCRGLVLGISGGIDSAVAAAIAKEAFPDNCLGLVMPCESDIQDVTDGRLVAEFLKIPYHEIALDDVFKSLLDTFATHIKPDPALERLLKANIKPRLRMTCLYYFAQANHYLVLGTSNKSEIMVGYDTKHGDDGVDLQVLGDLRKDQVYELAKYLNIPQPIIERKPSAGLWIGQTDEDEMGISYKDLDEYIRSGQGDVQTIAKIQALHEKSAHKRQMPPIAILPANFGENPS